MPDLDFKTIGQKIKARRQSVNITQEVMANYLDVNQSHISNIECGRANPSLTLLIKLQIFWNAVWIVLLIMNIPII